MKGKFTINVHKGVSAIVAAESAIKKSGRDAVNQLVNTLIACFGSGALPDEVMEQYKHDVAQAKRHEWKTPGSVRTGMSVYLAVLKARVLLAELLKQPSFKPANFYWNSVIYWSQTLNREGSVRKALVKINAKKKAPKAKRHTANADLETAAKALTKLITLPKLDAKLVKAIQKLVIDFDLAKDE